MAPINGLIIAATQDATLCWEEIQKIGVDAVGDFGCEVRILCACPDDPLAAQVAPQKIKRHIRNHIARMGVQTVFVDLITFVIDTKTIITTVLQTET